MRHANARELLGVRIFGQAGDGPCDVGGLVVAGHQYGHAGVVRGDFPLRTPVHQDRADQEGVHEARYVGDKGDDEQRQRPSDEARQVIHPWQRQPDAQARPS